MEVRYPPPPPPKGYLSDAGAIPYENKANGCDTPSAILSRKGIARYGGVSRTGPLSLRSSKCFLGVQSWSPFVARKSGQIWRIWAEMTQTLMPKSAKVAQIHLPECNSRQNSPSFRQNSAKFPPSFRQNSAKFPPSFRQNSPN